MSDRRTDGTDYTGPERRRDVNPHPPRFSDAIHLSPGFAYTLAGGLLVASGFIFGMRGDVDQNAAGILRTEKALAAEAVERKAADSLALDRLTRAQDDNSRKVDRLADKMDAVKDLLVNIQLEGVEK